MGIYTRGAGASGERPGAIQTYPGAARPPKAALVTKRPQGLDLKERWRKARLLVTGACGTVSRELARQAIPTDAMEAIRRTAHNDVFSAQQRLSTTPYPTTGLGDSVQKNILVTQNAVGTAALITCLSSHSLYWIRRSTQPKSRALRIRITIRSLHQLTMSAGRTA